MTGDQLTIQDYARAFEGHLAGSSEERAGRRAELVEHLSDAAEEGDLARALERLGSPEQAAQTFARAHGRPGQSARAPARVGGAEPLLIVAVPLEPYTGEATPW